MVSEMAEVKLCAQVEVSLKAITELPAQEPTFPASPDAGLHPGSPGLAPSSLPTLYTTQSGQNGDAEEEAGLLL